MNNIACAMPRLLTFLIIWIIIAFVTCLAPGPDVLDQAIQSKANMRSVAAPQESFEQTNNSSLDDAPSGVLESTAVEPAHSPVSGIHSEVHPRLSFCKTLSVFFTENVKTKERLGHMIPMIGIAFCLIRLLLTRGWRWYAGLLAAWAFVFGLALSIELLQELLPESFHRGFAWDDIGFSMIGGLLAVLGGFLFSTSFPSAVSSGRWAVGSRQWAVGSG